VSSNISGNVGFAISTISVQCASLIGVQTPVTLYGQSDSSGNFTFSGLAAGVYRLTANTGGVSSGPGLSNTYRPLDVIVDGVNNVSGANLTPRAANIVS
jgi:hypothetical protein